VDDDDGAGLLDDDRAHGLHDDGAGLLNDDALLHDGGVTDDDPLMVGATDAAQHGDRDGQEARTTKQALKGFHGAKESKPDAEREAELFGGAFGGS
jgi:hypothetical protein